MIGSIGGAFAAATIPGPGGVIHACYRTPARGNGDDNGDNGNARSGTMRLVADERECKRDETAIAWNQVGPAGATGASGVQDLSARRAARVRRAIPAPQDSMGPPARPELP